MGIKQMPDGSYIVNHCVRHPITRKTMPLQRKAKSLAEAKRIHAELIVILNDRTRRAQTPTWPALLTQYIQHLENQVKMNYVEQVTLGTIYKREKVLRRHTLPEWQEKFIDEITANDIRARLEASLENYSESHRKAFVKMVRSVFQFAVDDGLIPKNPTPQIKFKPIDKSKKVLNEEQILTLLRKAQEFEWEWYCHYAVALYTGMRSSELIALTWDKVDLEKRTILVDCSWSKSDGLKSTKSCFYRVIEIPKALLPVLTELKLKTVATEEFVLPRIGRWEQGDAAKPLRLFLRSIGLPEVVFHNLRASWATMLLNRGVAPSKVMKMGGWASMHTMMIYMRSAGIDIKGATNCLDDMQIHGVESAKVIELRGEV
jgi:integrase